MLLLPFCVELHHMKIKSTFIEFEFDFKLIAPENHGRGFYWKISCRIHGSIEQQQGKGWTNRKKLRFINGSGSGFQCLYPSNNFMVITCSIISQS